ncbi:hypothetical protein BVC93_21825 [Mycobacterium sp. MS1601]|nr:hypothetical protein BVC93_21825 [Mycobacterium sp. MS1601]
MDPDAEAVVAARAKMPAANLEQLRLKYATAGRLFAPPVPARMTTDDIHIDMQSRGFVRARLYTPADVSTAGLLVWAHGGGWISGSVAGFDGTAAALATASHTRTLSIDYSLAPEAPFPRAVDEVRAVIDWTQTTAGTTALGHRLDRVVVGGDSAGGNLVTLAAASASGPMPLAGQVLAYPVTNHSVPDVTPNVYSPTLTAEALSTCWRLYLGNAETAAPQLFSPLHQELSRLPPTLIVLAGLDILHRDGVSYGNALNASGVSTRLATYPTMPHGFLEWADKVRASRHALAHIGKFVLSRAT